MTLDQALEYALDHYPTLGGGIGAGERIDSGRQRRESRLRAQTKR
jgi:hypothetical protein